MPNKKIPMRMCLGCNAHKPKKELIRVVKGPDGSISLDLTGKKSGRGAYICNDISCLQKARKSKRIDRVLECEIPEEVYNSMEGEIEKGAG